MELPPLELSSSPDSPTFLTALPGGRQTANAIEIGTYDSNLPLTSEIARVLATTIEEIFKLDGNAEPHHA